MIVRKGYIGAFSLVFAIWLTGCSSEMTNQVMSQEASKQTYEINDFADRTISFTEPPKKIVALANGDVDMIYALGGEVVGRPTAQTTVKEAEAAEQIGSTHEINLEKIALLKPDVVLANSNMNTKDIQSIELVGAKTVLTNANSINDIKKQIALFGDMLQKEDAANSLLLEMDEKLKQMNNSSASTKPKVLLVYGAPGTYMAALSNSLSGDILTFAGGSNIAEDYPALEKFPQYAQINTERVVESNPDMIFLMTHGNEEEVKKGFLKEMQQNAAWNSIRAVENGRVEILPADLFGTNPGTKVTDAILYLKEKMSQLE